MITAATYFLLEWCSSQVPVGAQNFESRSTEDVERLLSMLRFENKGKLKPWGLKLIQTHLNQVINGSSPLSN